MGDRCPTDPEGQKHPIDVISKPQRVGIAAGEVAADRQGSAKSGTWIKKTCSPKAAIGNLR